jgi:hypothetical protein
MKTFRVASRSFKQAIISGGRVIMTTADESRLLNSLYVKTIDGGHRSRSSIVMLCSTYVSKGLNSETPGWPYVVVFSFRVFSNKGTRQISSTSRWRLFDHNAHITVVSCGGDEPVLGKSITVRRRTSAHARSRANTACRRFISCKLLCSIEKTILAKFSAASPQAEAPVPSLLYWRVPL